MGGEGFRGGGRGMKSREAEEEGMERPYRRKKTSPDGDLATTMGMGVERDATKRMSDPRTNESLPAPSSS